MHKELSHDCFLSFKSDWNHNMQQVVIMVSVRTAKDLKLAVEQMYGRLAGFLMGSVDLSCVSLVLEAGCGRGQLTFPLAERMGERCKIIAFDISSGPYSGVLGALGRAVREKKLGGVIKMAKGDVRNMFDIKDESVDLVISNELLCELDRRGLKSAMGELHRILKRGRQMVHAELSPFSENKAQELFIKANFYSMETMTPRPSWFSPTADEIAVNLRRTGFKKIHVKYFETNLKLGFNIAVRQLRRWKTAPTFLSRYEKELREYGWNILWNMLSYAKNPRQMKKDL